MNLRNFTQANQDPQKPSGPCEVGGHPAHCFFDRSNPSLAWITVRFDMTPAAPLPGFAKGCTELDVDGTAVPVRVVQLKCKAEALQGSIDPALVEAVVTATAPPAVPADAAAERPPAGAADPPPPADGGDAVMAKVKAYQGAKAACTEAQQKLAAVRKAERRLQRELEDAAEEREELEAALPALEASAREIRQQLRDALDREEAA